MPKIMGLTASPVKGRITRSHDIEMIGIETTIVMQHLTRQLNSDFAPIPSYNWENRKLTDEAVRL